MSGRYDFASDNVAPAAPEAIAALSRFNAGFAPAYGADEVTRQADDLAPRLPPPAACVPCHV